MKSYLEGGFPLRCFQRLSRPYIATLLRGWRDTGWREGLVPQTVRSSLWAWRFVAERPALYRLGSAAAVRAMRLFRRGGWIGRMPLAGSWTRYRDLPAPPARTFMQQLGDRNMPR